MHLFLIKIQQLKFQVRLLVTGTWHSFATAALAHDVKTKTKEAKNLMLMRDLNRPVKNLQDYVFILRTPLPASCARQPNDGRILWFPRGLKIPWLMTPGPEPQSERRVNQIWLDRIPDSSKKTERVFMIPEERREMSLDHVFAFRAYHTCSTCTYD